MSALSRLRAAGVEVRLNDGDPVASGLDQLLPEMAGPLLKMARACREAIRAELLAGPCPYTEAELARFRESHGHLVCCPITSRPWWWVERSWCESACQTPCGRGEELAENKRTIQ